MRVLKPLFLCLLLFSSSLVSGCRPSPGNPVTLTMWHNFGGQMQTTMNGLVDEFNQTVGQENGIFLSITSISDTATLRDKLTMIADDDPGAPEMPDISTCYPQTALILAEKDLLAPLNLYFDQGELSRYVPRFIAEGRLEDGSLYVFPFAKSTEVLFVNQTLFDQFSIATGITMEQLKTFEGIANAALMYYQWTDDQTPRSGDGKHFFTADSLFNLAQVGMRQLGSDLIVNERLVLDSPEYQRIWSCLYQPAVKGGYAIYDGYSSDLAKTGEIVCSTGSTAGILFYGTEITYPDNTTQEVEYTVLPFPVFQGGGKVAIQRGGGLVVAKSTPEKEKAAALFLKWFTAPLQNMEFVASTGYLPVTIEAFEDSIEKNLGSVDNENVRKLLMAAITVQREYDFYIPPLFDEFDSLSTEYENDLNGLAAEARAEYLHLLEVMDPEQAYQQATQGDYELFTKGR